MVVNIEDNEINALNWLLLKGMEITKSDKKYDIFESIVDKLLPNKSLLKEQEKNDKYTHNTTKTNDSC